MAKIRNLRRVEGDTTIKPTVPGMLYFRQVLTAGEWITALDITGKGIVNRISIGANPYFGFRMRLTIDGKESILGYEDGEAGNYSMGAAVSHNPVYSNNRDTRSRADYEMNLEFTESLKMEVINDGRWCYAYADYSLESEKIVTLNENALIINQAKSVNTSVAANTYITLLDIAGKGRTKIMDVTSTTASNNYLYLKMTVDGDEYILRPPGANPLASYGNSSDGEAGIADYRIRYGAEIYFESALKIEIMHTYSSTTHLHAMCVYELEV